MPFTPDMRRRVDQIRDYLYGGGYPDPLTNAEQLSFLFFFYMIEGIDGANLRQAKATGRPYTQPVRRRMGNSQPAQRADRRKGRVRAARAHALVILGQCDVRRAARHLGSRRGVPVLRRARRRVRHELHGAGKARDRRADRADADRQPRQRIAPRTGRSRHEGRSVRARLRQIKQAGELGQFRTPRHIIRAIVALVDPKIGETVYDPAAGTAGFLVAAYEHIRLANSSPHGRETAEFEGKAFERGFGDRLSQSQWRRLQTATFYGNDVDGKMVSLASMNLALRGLPDVRILRRNVLTTTFDRQAKAERNLPLDGYDVILANPPFSGRLDRDRIVDDVKIGTSTATELLFVKYMMDNLKARRPVRRHRARGRAVRLDRRAQGTAPHADAEQPGRGGAVTARRRVPALFRGQDLGADLRQRRAHRACHVPARRF